MKPGFVIGALSARDLLRLRAGEAVSLGDEIDEADDVHALGAAWAKLPQVATSLLAEGHRARRRRRHHFARTRRADPPGRGDRRAAHAGGRATASRHAPMRWPCWARPGAAKACSRWIRTTPLCSSAAIRAERRTNGSRRSAAHVADILNEVGVPYCKGGVMAQQRRLARLGRDLAARGSRTGSHVRGRRTCCRSTFSSIMRGVHGQLGSPTRCGATP